jgi:hypothetical protein
MEHERALRRLVFEMARQMVTILNHIEREQSAVLVRRKADEFAESLYREDFEPAIQALEDEGMETSFEHTGGNVYVLYVYPTNSTSIRVGITPDEDRDGLWLVCGYESVDDEGTLIMEQAVPFSELYRTVYDMCEKLTQAFSKDVTFEIPGSFYAEFVNGTPRFKFIPHAGYAGYFGPDAFNADTAEPLDEALEDSFWERVGGLIKNGTFTGTWEE